MHLRTQMGAAPLKRMSLAVMMAHADAASHLRTQMSAAPLKLACRDL